MNCEFGVVIKMILSESKTIKDFSTRGKKFSSGFYFFWACSFQRFILYSEELLTWHLSITRI